VESPYQDLPEIPVTLDGKLKMVREQFDLFMRVVRETLQSPLATDDNVEAGILRNVARDLETMGPEAFEAFEEVKKAHLALAEEAVQLAKEIPERIREAEEKSAKDLACYAAENLKPSPVEPVPSFLELLDIETEWSELEALLSAVAPSRPEVERTPVTSGNIWENWQSGPSSSPAKKTDSCNPAEYRFPVELLKSLGLELEPEKHVPPGGNIWENWR